MKINPCRQSFASIKQQSGLAMLMVVGVVVLMITMLAFLLEDQHVLMRQTGNQRVAEQSQQYLHGLNAWALRVLHEDIDRAIDHENEAWARFGRPVPEQESEQNGFSLDPTLRLGKEQEEEAKIDFGIDTVEVTIDDLQGRFNLNNLASQDKKSKFSADQKRIFLNLLQILEIGEFHEDREDMYAALLDWLDDNDTYSSNTGRGAESGDYQSKSTPYHASDQPISSIGELRYVEGFEAKTVKKLSPFIAVLPVQNAKLNLNTVTPEVLASLAGGLVADISPALGFLGRKEQPGFLGFNQGDLEAAQTAINGVSPGSNSIEDMLQVSSQYFQINTKVELGGIQTCMRTVVLRPSANPDTLSDQNISVLSREQDTICKEESAEASTEQSTPDEDIR